MAQIENLTKRLKEARYEARTAETEEFMVALDEVQKVIRTRAFYLLRLEMVTTELAARNALPDAKVARFNRADEIL